MQDEKEKTCCHGKESAEHSCCHEKTAEAEHSCCHNKAAAEKTSCCHGETKSQETEHSCCHSQAQAEEETHSCCHEKTAETEHSCCHGKAEETEHSCCHEKAKQPKHSCCHHEEERQTYGSCCGGGEEKQSYGSCCGSGHKKKNGFWGKYGQYVILGVSLAALIVSFIAPLKNDPIWKYLDFGWIAVVLCAPPIFIGAFKRLSRGKISSGLLISMSITACIVLEILMWTGVLGHADHSHSNIFAAGEVAWLMTLGEMLENLTVKKARSGVERLVKLAPTTAKYRIDGQIVEKPLSEVRVGDEVVVLPNDMLSVDGVIVEGSTSIDESVMTGESVPVDKGVGDSVYGGTWNKQGALTVRVTRAQDDMAVTKLRKLVEEAEGKKAPISKVADRWAGYIVPSALILSVIIFFVAYFGFRVGVTEAVERAVTMLVVFCPCALALATPTAIAAGLGNATKKGMLIKSGGALETLAHIDTVAFDKTGTLTEAHIEVTDFIALDGDEARVAAVAGACERFSEHPLAKAVYAACAERVEIPNATDTRSLVGAGVAATVDGKSCKVVKFDALAADGIAAPAERARALMGEGKTVVAVVEDGKAIGLLALADRLRDGAADAIAELKDMKIDSVMLTGDNASVAESVAGTLGITQCCHSLLPEQKLEKIESMKADGRKVCMVGDGVNDAPALALADTSVAMGALGSDAAIETAEVALMTLDIKKLPLLVRLGRRALTTIKINIILSMTINVCSVVLSTLGLLNPITGALVHNVSSVLVVLHSSLLLAYKGNKKKTET